MNHLQVSARKPATARVAVVGLAAAATTQRRDPDREPGRHVEDRLTFGDQPPRQTRTDTAGTLDSPDAVAVDAAKLFIDR